MKEESKFSDPQAKDALSVGDIVQYQRTESKLDSNFYYLNMFQELLPVYSSSAPLLFPTKDSDLRAALPHINSVLLCSLYDYAFNFVFKIQGFYLSVRKISDTQEKPTREVYKLCKIWLNVLKWFGLSGKARENICADFFQDAH